MNYIIGVCHDESQGHLIQYVEEDRWVLHFFVTKEILPEKGEILADGGNKIFSTYLIILILLPYTESLLNVR